MCSKFGLLLTNNSTLEELFAPKGNNQVEHNSKGKSVVLAKLLFLSFSPLTANQR